MERAHLALSVLALVACNSESTSQTHIVCGEGQINDSNGCQEAPCMTDALGSGVLAEVSLDTFSENWFSEYVYAFTVGNQVKMFWDYPDGDGVSSVSLDETDEITCTGPFDVGFFGSGVCPDMGYLVVEGCPGGSTEIVSRESEREPRLGSPRSSTRPSGSWLVRNSMSRSSTTSRPKHSDD